MSELILKNCGIQLLFDVEDIDKWKVLDFRWYGFYNKTEQRFVNVCTTIHEPRTNYTRKTKNISFHRLVLGLYLFEGKLTDNITLIKTDSKTIVDHINHNVFDNRKENLRICTNQQNCMNRTTPKNNTSGFKGVVWHKKANKWQTTIMFNKKNIFLGLYKDKIEAAQIYDRKAIELFGAFAYTNFPLGNYI